MIIGILAPFVRIPRSVTAAHGADVGRDHHPGHSAADRRLFPAGHPRWFAAKRRFHDAERVLLRLRDTSAEAKREPMKFAKACRLNRAVGRCSKSKQQLPPRRVSGILLQVMQHLPG